MHERSSRRATSNCRPHVGPLLLLGAAHLLIFSRALFSTTDGHIGWFTPWDFDAGYHRELVFLSDSLKAGFLPLWNPYAAAGSPFFLNPQSQLWAPITWLVATTVGYTHDVAQRQNILALLAGGVGAYALAWTLWRRRWAALVAGTCYSLSPALYGNMQHMDFISADAYIPWLFWTATLTSLGKRWSFPLLSFFIYGMITSGYPALMVMTFAWLGLYCAYLIGAMRGTQQVRWQYLLRGAAAW